MQRLTFLQQVNHVLHPARNVPMGQPDLRHTNLPNVPYRSDTLKANLERVSIGAAPPTTRGLQELVRMSDWDHEFKRTAIFCSAYFISWIFGRTLMVVTAFFVVLICFPFTRRLIFPNVSGAWCSTPVLTTGCALERAAPRCAHAICYCHCRRRPDAADSALCPDDPDPSRTG